LRYQFNGVPYDVNNLLSTLFTNPSGSAPFTFTIAGDREHGLPPLYNNDWHDFEPRIGFAWYPFKQGKTSIRASYGTFDDRVFGQLLGLTRGNPPFQQIFFAPTFNPMAGGPAVSTLPLPPTLTATAVVNNEAGNFPFLVDPHLRMPYSQNWNLGVQESPFPTLLIEVDYVGSKGIRLLRVIDGNPPQPNLVAQLEAFCVPTNPANSFPSGQCDQRTLQFNNLYFGAESGVLPFDAVNNNAFLHAAFFTGAASSIYHALQVNITKRLSRGLAIQGAYTWSHAIDNSSDPLVPTAGNQEFPRNSFDLAAERGNSDFDVRQRLVVNYTWEIPVGRGHSHMADGPAGKILEGWQVAGIATFSSGLPFDIFTDLDTAHVGEIQRPDFSPAGIPAPVGSPRTQTGPNLGFFPNPPFGRGGDLGRNRFRGPRYQQLGHGFAEDYPHLRTPRSGIPNGGLQSFQPHSVQPARESHVQSGHLWTIDLRSEACRWNLRRTANPVRHETHILKAFDIEGSQAGGLLASRRNFAARGVPAKARIRSQDRPYMGVAGWRVSFADPTRK